MVAVTLAETEQLEFAAIEALARLIDVAFAVAVKVPPQVLVAFEGLATTIPEGNVSVKPIPVIVAVLLDGFVIVTVSVEVPPGNVMLVGANAMAAVGAPRKFNVAVPVVPVPPLVALTLPVVLT